MATPHNNAEKGDIADIVLMPGDPLRAEMIANNYLTDPVKFNDIRNMYGYTGFYDGRRISVMASGMGMPSMGIYSYELFNEYGVEYIIRLGSAGSYSEKADLFDTILCESSYTESTFAKVQSGYDKNIHESSPLLNEALIKSAKELEKKLIPARVHTTDVFYRNADSDYYKELLRKYNTIAVEMESFALFHNAYILNKKAAALLTISDSFVSDKKTTAMERQLSFTDMVLIALNSIKYID